MPDKPENDPKLILAVRDEVDAYIKRRATFIGLPSLIVVVAMLVFSFFWFQQQAVQAATDTAKKTALAQLVEEGWTRERIDSLKQEAAHASGRLNMSRELITDVQKKLKELDAEIAIRSSELRAALDRLAGRGSALTTTVEAAEQRIAKANFAEVDAVLAEIGKFKDHANLLFKLNSNATQLEALTTQVEDLIAGDLQLARIRVRELVVEDDNDAKLAKINAERGGGSLTIYRGGKPRAALGLSATGSGTLRLIDSAEQESAKLLAHPDGGACLIKRAGRTIASMVPVDGDGYLRLFNSDGEQRVSLGTGEKDGGGLWLINSSDQESAQLVANPVGGACLIQRAGKTIVSLGQADGNGDLWVWDSEGTPRARLGTSPEDNGALWLYDANGKVRAP